MTRPKYLAAVGDLTAGPDVDEGFVADVDGRPYIVVNDRELHEVRTDTLTAMRLAQRHNPDLFVRDGGPVTVGIDEDERPSIRTASLAALRNVATDSATFVTKTNTKSGITITRVPPPKDVVEAVAALTPLPFPPLRGVTEAPTLRPDGTVISDPGYDAATGLYFVDRSGDDAIAPKVRVPDDPTADEIAAARDDLLHLISDFPFVDQASRANYVGCLILSVIRTAIAAPTPLNVFDAPVPGSGKTLLATVAGELALGRTPAMTSVPDDPAEWRKALTAALVEGRGLIVLDNVSGALMSPYMAQMLTERIHSDRLLGTNKTVTVPNNATWICTGNGVALRGDLPRRAIWVRLDPRMARPWERDGFAIDDIETHVAENRPRYLANILTLARAWFAAGQPAPSIKPLGSFTRWSIVIGGILQHVGVEGFMDNAEAAWDEGDGEVTDMTSLLQTIREWRGGCSTPAFKVSELAEKFEPGLQDRGRWLDLLPPEWTAAADGRGAALNRKIGDTFRAIAGRRWDEHGLRIVKSEKKDRTKAVLWVVETDDPS